MLNHITIMGRMVRDPELRRTGSGVAVASFTLAVDRDFKASGGGEKEVDFIDCVAWRQAGEFVSKYFTRGRMAVVSGRLQIRSWNDKDAKGLIVPRFGNKPENHVAVSMTFDALSELLLMTKTHYEAWLTAWYLSQTHTAQPQNQKPANASNPPKQAAPSFQPNQVTPEYSGMRMF